ncbi:MAG TPA: hypothetical protein VFQ24_19000 [Terriglobia bacterium]|nr:hypothetical protein [Terriglobia bacterium]
MQFALLRIFVLRGITYAPVATPAGRTLKALKLGSDKGLTPITVSLCLLQHYEYQQRRSEYYLEPLLGNNLARMEFC